MTESELCNNIAREFKALRAEVAELRQRLDEMQERQAGIKHEGGMAPDTKSPTTSNNAVSGMVGMETAF